MTAELPDITPAGHRLARHHRDRVLGFERAVSARLVRLVDRQVDLGQAEPGQLDIELEVDQRLELDREDLLVPPAFIASLLSANT